jgi:glycosyltransferase involved in cell wall biosynthesis
MNIKVLMITFNRPDYTKKSLARLCDTAPRNLRVTVWDNGSNTETKEVLEKYRSHWCVENIIFNKTNDKLRGPTNWFWENSQTAELLGKVDDDCLVPEDWCGILEEAHKDIPEAGILGCWRFLPEDFRYEKAVKKIWTYGTHQILRNCWVEGSGYLMKREVVHKIGFLKDKESFTGFCTRAAAQGFINGWYYPFLFQEHMDDPRVPNTGIRSEEDFRKLIPLTAINFRIKTKEEWLQCLMKEAQNHQEYSINPYDFIGLRARLKRKFAQIMGDEYLPKVK